MSTVYFAGGEDSEFYQVGGGLVDTTAGRFRSAYARCALFGNSASDCYWVNWYPFSLATFYTSGQVTRQDHSTSNNFGALRWFDTSLIQRLRISGTGGNDTFKVEKLDSTGTATQLGSNFTMVQSGFPDHWVVYIDYKVAGTVTVWHNAIQCFTYAGDVTTNSITTLTNIGVGQGGGSRFWDWSEIILCDTDPRSWNLQTLQPVANGNTHNFDVGTPAAANVNEIVLSDATLDGATANGLIDQYTIPAIAAGTYTIISIVVSARAQKGSSGPSKLDVGVRSGATDYWSSDFSLTTSWTDYQNVWNTDPNTATTWAALPANIGIKAVT